MSLQLPKTQLKVSSRWLTKLGPDDAVVAELPLDSIRDVRLEKVAEYPFPAILISVFVALAFVSKNFGPSTGWGWAGAIIFLGLAAFAVLMIQQDTLVIETDQGLIHYSMSDDNGDAEGFIISLKYRLSALSEVASSLESNA